ncbi:ankyrin repeat domain-containing protein 26-like isoform X1 [Falco naumanni]|uniref:ankyrin repeat domain-containing protein 26-like isoform X1 n=1 Tax=Falco naumanni TaxID=148594 RepID=UPI001ADE71A1|nr:ankyrin repeat domain-containing protein 26-like isoform X1 [Falco naumanni]
MRGNHEKLEKSKSQLKEEVANLKHHMETNVVDRSQIELYKREVEEQAAQEIRQKLQEVNLILQMQAASQDTLEQIRASRHALLTNQLEHRIGDLERELDRIKNTQRDSIFQKESAQAEVEKYKDLYLEEVQQELDEKIAKELKQVTAEFEAGSAGASPMVFSDGSSKSIHVDQDPLCRAVQEYRDVLTKNYLI